MFMDGVMILMEEGCAQGRAMAPMMDGANVGYGMQSSVLLTLVIGPMEKVMAGVGVWIQRAQWRVLLVALQEVSAMHGYGMVGSVVVLELN
jgi:hypothetical protein